MGCPRRASVSWRRARACRRPRRRRRRARRRACPGRARGRIGEHERWRHLAGFQLEVGPSVGPRMCAPPRRARAPLSAVSNVPSHRRAPGWGRGSQPPSWLGFGLWVLVFGFGASRTSGLTGQREREVPRDEKTRIFAFFVRGKKRGTRGFSTRTRFGTLRFRPKRSLVRVTEKSGARFLCFFGGSDAVEGVRAPSPRSLAHASVNRGGGLLDLVVALACVAGTFGGIQRASEAGAWVRKSTRRIPIPRIRAASRNTCANEKFPKERATEAERGAGSEREKRAKSGWVSGGGSAVPLSRVARFVRRETEAEREGNARRPRRRRRRRQIPPRDSPVLCARAPCPAPRSPCSSSSLETRVSSGSSP